MHKYIVYITISQNKAQHNRVHYVSPIYHIYHICQVITCVAVESVFPRVTSAITPKTARMHPTKNSVVSKVCTCKLYQVNEAGSSAVWFAVISHIVDCHTDCILHCLSRHSSQCL